MSCEVQGKCAVPVLIKHSCLLIVNQLIFGSGLSSVSTILSEHTLICCTTGPECWTCKKHYQQNVKINLQTKLHTASPDIKLPSESPVTVFRCIQQVVVESRWPRVLLPPSGIQSPSLD